MPELPEVETVRKGLEKVALGRVVFYLKFYRKDLREEIPKGLVRSILLNQRLISISRRSKYLLMSSEKGTVISHLGMTGCFLYKKTREIAEKHTHFIIGVCDENKESEGYIHYVDPRRFGRLSGALGDPLLHPYLKDLGPEPLKIGKLKLASRLYGLARNKRCKIKNFIMDQRIVVGVGNIYACESLFSACIDPRREAKDITLEEFEVLSGFIQNTLRNAIRAGGTTIKDFQNAKGQTGYFAIKLKVYGKDGEPCVCCKTPISLIKQSGRSSWYCPICQI